MRIKKSELFDTLPPEWPDDLLPAIQAENYRQGRAVVVLDDDPTGTQTVHNIPVYTAWDVEAFVDGLSGPWPVFYVLTNSRSLELERVRHLNQEAAKNLAEASRRLGRPFDLISRSDSTLRGYFPLETDTLTDTLRSTLGLTFKSVVLCPFFLEGGRFTINDTHYVQEGEWLVPAAETEFAKDAVFGYTHSELPQWIAEKTAGRIRPQDVVSLSLADIRQGGPARVAEILKSAVGGQPVIVNAASYRDLEVVVMGMLEYESHQLLNIPGTRYLFRTAASFVRVRGGITPRPLLTIGDLYAQQWDEAEGRQGGLVIVGSHIQKSSQQLAQLLALDGVVGVELDVAQVLERAHREAELHKVHQTVADAIAAGQTAVVYTSRTLLVGATATENLRIGQSVSLALVEILKRLEVMPRFLVGKGGITASDLATEGLRVRQAEVLGQIAPGVPVWRTGAGSRFPGIPYVVFPGNVGDARTLADVVQRLRGA